MKRTLTHPTAPTAHRTGTVARMLGMPVATLRVWERRYQLTDTARSPSGQRLYSPQDVDRLALVKQLADLGHAIGRLASLDLAQLQEVATRHAQTLVTARPPTAHAPRPWRVAVVGQALGARLRKPALQKHLGCSLVLLGAFADVAQATAALGAQPGGAEPDAWLVQAEQLQPGWWPAFEAAAGPLAGRPVAVLMGFAADAVCEELDAQGVTLLREPQPDAALGRWLQLWAASQGVAASAPAPVHQETWGARGGRPGAAPRRWGDAALADFAALSSTVACECPRHLAELLMQLARFEAYSEQCALRNPADAELHAYLGRMAGESRAGLEAALEEVARREGLLLPPAGA